MGKKTEDIRHKTKDIRYNNLQFANRKSSIQNRKFPLLLHHLPRNHLKPIVERNHIQTLRIVQHI